MATNLSYDVTGDFAYAGFWWRVVAYIIDHIVSWLVTLICSPINAIILHGVWLAFSPFPEGNIAINIVYTILTYMLTLLPAMFYFSLMESSKKQATLGKMAVGLKVASETGERISFKVAVVRFYAKLLSELTFGIGYLVMLFTRRKQTLHDLIAKTIVVEKAWSKPEIQEQSSELSQLSQTP